MSETVALPRVRAYTYRGAVVFVQEVADPNSPNGVSAVPLGAGPTLAVARAHAALMTKRLAQAIERVDEINGDLSNSPIAMAQRPGAIE